MKNLPKPNDNLKSYKIQSFYAFKLLTQKLNIFGFSLLSQTFNKILNNSHIIKMIKTSITEYKKKKISKKNYKNPQ